MVIDLRNSEDPRMVWYFRVNSKRNHIPDRSYSFTTRSKKKRNPKYIFLYRSLRGSGPRNFEEDCKYFLVTEEEFTKYVRPKFIQHEEG